MEKELLNYKLSLKAIVKEGDLFVKKLNLMKLMAAFICVILLSSCGSSDSPDPIPLPNDNFSIYTTFPAAPWIVFDGSVTTTTNWAMLTPGAHYTGTTGPPLNYAALANNNYYSRLDSSVIARMKVVTPNSVFGIFQRITTDDVTQSSHSSYYQLAIDRTSSTIYFKKVVLGASSSLTGVPAAFGVLDPTIYHDYQFSITGSGTGTLTLTGFIDGTQVVQYTDNGSGTAILAWGYTGFYFNAVDNGSITHYQVTQP
jgi:hypothetical protein